MCIRDSNSPLPWSYSVKCLGLHVDCHLTWWTHSGEVTRKTASRLYQLLLCSNCMIYHLGKLIVTMYVVPVATYVIPVWGYLAKTHVHKLQSLLDRGLCWVCKGHYLTSAKII